jgi:hypothetical protein
VPIILAYLPEILLDLACEVQLTLGLNVGDFLHVCTSYTWKSINLIFVMLLFIDPPEKVTVSHEKLEVKEGSIPPRVLCSAKALPEPGYKWKNKDGEIISTGNSLIFNKPFYKKDAGIYFCEAKNKHGSSEKSFFINVL